MKKYLLVFFILTGCAKNPATNNMDFVVLSQEQEYQLGRVFREGTSNNDIYKNEIKQKYFNDLAQQVYHAGERPEQDMVFYLMKDDNPNAYAIPGYVFLNRGLLPFLQDEASLMGVLAHESAHINARHTVRGQSDNFLIRWVLNSLPVIIPKSSKNTITELSDLSYSRSYEEEADELAIKYMKNLGVPAINVAQLHKSMKMYEQIMLDLANMGEGNKKKTATAELLRTHPLSEKRAQMIEDKSGRWFTLMEPYKQAEYYKQINGMPYGYKSTNTKNKIVLTNTGVEVVKDKRSGVYGYKNIAYMKRQKVKLVMPEDYQARIMSDDPLGYNYKNKVKVDLYNVSDDKNIYAIDIIANLLGLNYAGKKKLIKKLKEQKQDFLENDYFAAVENKIKEGEQIFKFANAPSFIKRIFGQETTYYYIYVKQLDDAELEDYFNHFRVIVLSTNMKKSFDETMLNDILFIKDNLVELTKKQASAIKPLTIKTKQLETTTTIKELSQENIPYIHFNQEWFRIFNGLYDEYNTDVDAGTWIKLVPNPNKNI